MLKKIIFVKKGSSTFINKDESYLRKNYKLETIQIRHFHGIRLIIEQIGIFFRLLFQLRKYDAVFVWFSDFHGFFPVLLNRLCRKKTLVVPGGYDVYCLPEYNYGICTHPVRNFCAKFIYRNASHILAIGEKMREDVIHKAGNPPRNNQILNVPTGYDPSLWFSDSPKENRVLMVAYADDIRRIKIKGIDRFVEVAKAMPELEFYLVGLENKDKYFSYLPQNLHVTGYTEDIRNLYSLSMVYLQLSLTEGFPNVLCESMLCECVPVATDVGGSREIVGETGYLIKNYTVDHTVRLIRQAINSDVKKKGNSARKRIIENYSYKRRAEIIDKILMEK